MSFFATPLPFYGSVGAIALCSILFKVGILLANASFFFLEGVLCVALAPAPPELAPNGTRQAVPCNS